VAFSKGVLLHNPYCGWCWLAELAIDLVCCLKSRTFHQIMRVEFAFFDFLDWLGAYRQGCFLTELALNFISRFKSQTFD
jgi:hypothetical protein